MTTEELMTEFHKNFNVINNSHSSQDELAAAWEWMKTTIKVLDRALIIMAGEPLDNAEKLSGYKAEYRDKYIEKCIREVIEQARREIEAEKGTGNDT